MATEEGQRLLRQLTADVYEEQRKTASLVRLLGHRTAEDINTDKELISTGALKVESTPP